MTFSSFELSMFSKCEAMFLYRNKKFENNEFQKMNKLYKSIFFGQLQAIQNKTTFSRDFSKEIQEFGTDIVIKINENLDNEDLTCFFDTQNVVGINKSSIISFSNASVKTKLDVFGFRNEKLSTLKLVFSNAVKQDKDIQSLITAIATIQEFVKKDINDISYEEYPKEVIVYKVSVVNKSSAILSYSREELFAGLEIVKATVNRACFITKNKDKAMVTPDNHCANCPHSKSCSITENSDNNIEVKVKQLKYYEEMIKSLKSELKDYAKELQKENIESVVLNKEIKIPFSDGTAGVFMFSSSEKVVKSRRKEAPTKKDIIKFLIENGDVSGDNDDIANLDIKLSKELVEHIVKEVPEWKNYFSLTTSNSVSIDFLSNS